MKVHRSQLIVFAFAALFAFSLSARAQTAPRAHRHPGNAPSMLREIEPDVSFVETTLAEGAQIEARVKNKNRTFEAFLVDKTQIFVKDLKSGKIFEIKGLPFESRYFSDLVWADNQTLMFDRWAQPRYGNHYAFNVVRKKLTAAVPFPDESTLKQKPVKQTKARYYAHNLIFDALLV